MLYYHQSLLKSKQYAQAENEILLSAGEGTEEKMQKNGQNFIRQTTETESKEMIQKCYFK